MSMPRRTFDVCVVGMGYVGIPTAVALALNGSHVCGVDTAATRVDQINSGILTISESGLSSDFEKCVKHGTIRAFLRPKPSNVFVISVPTPINTEDKSPNLSHVFAAVDSIMDVLEKDNLVIVESTCPVGTTQEIIRQLEIKRPDLNFLSSGEIDPDVSVVYCPERVFPGNALEEITKNKRVCGAAREICRVRASNYFGKLSPDIEVNFTSINEAEVTKLAENCFRDVNIAFANELSLLCLDFGIDVHNVISAANQHPRVNILSPGPGVGGHCIPVDPYFLIYANKKNTCLIQTAREVNDKKTDAVISAISDLGHKFKNKKIICCGLTFKPNVDDIRESPSLRIYNHLTSIFGNRVFAIDPFVDKKIDPKIQFLEPTYLEHSSDILALLVDHDLFKEIKPTSNLIYDSRGVWSRNKV